MTARVVLCLWSGLSPELLDADATPHLWHFAEAGGRAVEGGEGCLPSLAHPCVATLLTGAAPDIHGLHSGRVWQDGVFVPADRVGPRAATLVEAAAAAGRDVRVALGDPDLVGVVRATAAQAHWPAGGEDLDGVVFDVRGKPLDGEVLIACDRLDVAAADLAVVQLPGIASAALVHGPDAPESRWQRTATDAVFGELLERLRPGWDRTVVAVVGDHGFARRRREPLDLAARIEAVAVHQEGGAALVVGAADLEALEHTRGVASIVELDHYTTVVLARRGVAFADPSAPPGRGVAGGHDTRAQAAVIGGGHPAVALLADQLRQVRPPAESWAALASSLLGVPYPFSVRRHGARRSRTHSSSRRR